MALKKSELYSSLWSSCDELRGGMDASQYKDYVLVLLFIKYVSDKYAGVPYAPIEIPEGASFKSASDFKAPERRRLAEQGYTILISIGDQESDLAGGFAERTFKLPNPVYFLP